jgi:hypothetical protein
VLNISYASSTQPGIIFYPAGGRHIWHHRNLKPAGEVPVPQRRIRLAPLCLIPDHLENQEDWGRQVKEKVEDIKWLR